MRERVRYHFDNLLARGTWAVLLYLAAVTLAALILSAVLLAIAGVTLAGSEDSSFLEDLWQSMLRVIDPGTMVADVGWGRRLLALAMTLFGILVAGTLIGLIASGVEQRVEEMQRGRSVVVETGHVLILGASPRLPVIVNQLTLAARKRRGNAIVVLADREPRELSDEVRRLVTDTRGSRLVFRWGDPTRPSDLSLVRAARARVIIVLADEDDDADTGVVKATLAVRAELGDLDRVPVIAELGSVEAAEGLSLACGGQIHAVVPQQGIARVTAFTLGQPGLSGVVDEILDFRGSDIYVRELGDLLGSPFGTTISRFAKARPIGRLRADGEVELNPAPHTALEERDRLIVLGDDDRSTLEERETPPRGPTPTDQWPSPRARRRRERLLIIGWSGLGAELLGQLGQLSAPETSAEVVYDARRFTVDELRDATSSCRLAVTFTPTEADIWQPTDDTQLAETTSIVFLGYRRGIPVEQADSRTLMNAMLMAQRLDRQGHARPRIIVELLNADNVELARVSGADDYLVSDAITSRFIAQLAEQPERRSVLLSLYGPEGPSIGLVEADELGLEGELGWDELVDRAYGRGLLVIGWRRSSARGGELFVNPHAGDRFALEADDQLVVIG